MRSLKFNAIVTTFNTMDAQEQADLLRMCLWMRYGFSRFDAHCTHDPGLGMIFKYMCERTNDSYSKDTMQYERWLHIREMWSKIKLTITGGTYVHKTQTCSLSTQEIGFCIKPGLVDAKIDNVLHEAYSYQLHAVYVDGVDLAKMLCDAN